ncbi:radical SAM domain protein [delta proteobacterium NaphS2]|nr:radical SAM domain protein [delta proteobacterium NaphS2]
MGNNELKIFLRCAFLVYMYLLKLVFENSAHSGDGCFNFRKKRNSRTIAKWTCVGNEKAGRELLMLITIGLGGEKYLNALPVSVALLRDRHRPLRVAYVLARHYPLDIQNRSIPVLGSGVEVDAAGRIVALRAKDLSFVSSHVPVKKLNIGKQLSAYFFLAYGGGYRPGPEGEDFSFTDPLFRRTRFHSLLIPDAPLTHPGDFIARLRYKGIRWGRTPSKYVLNTLCTQISRKLRINIDSWLDPNPNDGWDALRPWQQRALLPILDIARHMMDAFPKCATPLEMPGVVLMDQPETFCTRRRLKEYLTLLDTLFPQIQFILSMDTAFVKCLPTSFWKKRLFLPDEGKPPAAVKPVRLPKDTVLLIDVDGRLPNLALMKLSAHYRSKGHSVWLGKRDCFLKGPDRVYASTLFYSPRSERRNHRLRSYYGEKLTVGGTGEDVSSRLPEEVEDLPPDYQLYPELGDRAIGFITRGCPFACPFCVVPRKEGEPRQVCDLDTLLEGGRRNKLILLDDNILSHPDADRFLQGMIEQGIMVNFTQTLDLRLINRERAELLRKLKCSNTRFTRSNFHFSLNHNRNLDLMARKYRLFNFKARDNVEFVCMYGCDTTLEEDVDRFAFLRSLPGAYVFMQKYLPIRGGPPADTVDFLGADPDRWIDQLVGIVFTQNMKSMENYYRWVSRRYALAYGKLHTGLVDTIFRYNNRDKKGEYIASLAGTKKTQF